MALREGAGGGQEHVPLLASRAACMCCCCTRFSLRPTEKTIIYTGSNRFENLISLCRRKHRSCQPALIRGRATTARLTARRCSNNNNKRAGRVFRALARPNPGSILPKCTRLSLTSLYIAQTSSHKYSRAYIYRTAISRC